MSRKNTSRYRETAEKLLRLDASTAPRAFWKSFLVVAGDDQAAIDCVVYAALYGSLDLDDGGIPLDPVILSTRTGLPSQVIVTAIERLANRGAVVVDGWSATLPLMAAAIAARPVLH